MKQKKVVVGSILIVFLLAGVLWGLKMYLGSSQIPKKNDAAMAVLAAKTKEKYTGINLGDKKKYVYKEPINGIHRQEEICLSLGYDAMDVDVTYWKEMYSLFQDKNLQKEVTVAYEWDEKEHVLHMSPNGNGANKIAISSLDTGIVKQYSHSSLFLFDTDAPQWGNLNTLYLACFYDEETGEKLDSPTVHVVNLEGELPKEPKLSYNILEDGRLNLQWSPVEGAENYIICMAEQKSYGYSSGMVPIAYTTECGWTSELPKMDDLKMNQEFKYFDFGEDDWAGENYTEEKLQLFKEEYPKEYKKKAVINYLRDFEERYLCVVAISKEGNSMPSNMIRYSQLASNLPYGQAIYTQKANKMKNSASYQSIEDLPMFTYIEMCDGRVFKKLFDYATEDATVTMQHLYDTNGEGEVTGREEVMYLNLPYSIVGTGFIGVMVVENYDEKNLTADLKTIEKLEEQMRMKGGSVTPSIDTDKGEVEQIDEKIVDYEEAVSEKNQVYANSALSEYLAVNLLAGKKMISLAEFPEAASDEILLDALNEAYYQNPMIMGVLQYGTMLDNKYLIVTYRYEQKERERLQSKTQEQVKKITADIIRDGMTDAEKEMAINAYLCSHTEYDYDALANAQENEFVSVSDTFYNSFNAYGALVEGKCVCQGYADAFSLLAREAGLEVLTVTGMLDGETPHAWNKVKIDDKWCVIDSTNNDNDYLGNVLFNIPFSVSDKVLVEDTRYLLDDYLTDYEEQNENYEFYHLTENFYQVDTVVNKLVENLKQSDNGMVVLRTDYQINDEDFKLITAQVQKKVGSDKQLLGAHWLGVICIVEAEE